MDRRRMRLCDGVSRREALRVGGLSALGLSFAASESLASRTPVSGRAKSVIVFWLSGGAPQHETFDPKPDASQDIRGDFGTIATSIPGFRVGELMPQTARHVDKLAVLRAVCSNDNAHSTSGYQMHTGVPHVPLSRENATAQKPNLYPSLGAMVRRFLPEQGGLPSAVTLPRNIANVGEIVWPGQDAGFLGHRYDPWFVNCDPSAPDFEPPALTLNDALTPQRLAERQRLLAELSRDTERFNLSPQAAELDFFTDRAFDLLSEGRTRRAFHIGEETEATRDRYGRYKFGQSVLLSRRLIESGVRLVQVNWQQLEGKENNGSWDTHKKHSESLRGWLMPLMDQTFSALLEDLDQRGMLDETLVAWVSEFGHTPKFNKNAGRDHWGKAFSVALAGAGVQGGAVWGATDRNAGETVEGQVAPRDITATILHCLGIPADSVIHDDQGRPLPLCRGAAIQPILS